MKRLLQDSSLSAWAAGFIVVLVGVTSSAVLIFQAAQVAGLTPEQASSWLGSVCIVTGILSIALSIYYRAPILFAWSTAGAALLVTSLKDIALTDAIGCFLFSGFLIFLSGITGVFEKIMNRIPIALSAALLAGVLFQFVTGTFTAFKTQPLLIGLMFILYLIGRRWQPRMTMLLVLVGATVIAGLLGLLHVEQLQLKLMQPHFVAPTFSIQALLSLGVPLFVVTMASQNLTGISVMRANHVNTPISPLLTWSGLANMITAPFGGFALNLAAITAAIALGPESHPDPRRRYVSAVTSGFFYLLIGIFAASATSLFAAFPNEMIIAITGIALLATIASSLQSALHEASYREAAMVTFGVTASGLTLFGVGSAFWGLVAGAITQIALSFKKPA